VNDHDTNDNDSRTTTLDTIKHLYSEGMSNQQIAQTLGLTEQTVRDLVNHLIVRPPGSPLAKKPNHSRAWPAIKH
jgi:DNA-binding NarL/FixJ family response regulator